MTVGPAQDHEIWKDKQNACCRRILLIGVLLLAFVCVFGAWFGSVDAGIKEGMLHIASAIITTTLGFFFGYWSKQQIPAR